GEQAVGVVLDPEQKLEIARELDSLRIERIEAGFPRVSADDERAFRLVLEAGGGAPVWGVSRAGRAGLPGALLRAGPAPVSGSPPASSSRRSRTSSWRRSASRARTCSAASRAELPLPRATESGSLSSGLTGRGPIPSSSRRSTSGRPKRARRRQWSSTRSAS